jgi:diacylglycerol kinase (ATP)
MSNLKLPRARPATRTLDAADMPRTRTAGDATDRWALLLNARSFSLSQRDRAWQLETIAGRARVPVVPVHDRESIAGALDAVIAGGADLVAIAGGDGTIQAALSHLGMLPADRVPRLMVLGGGRTNLTSRDFGARGGPLAVFERARRPGAWLQTIRRRVLTLSQPGSPPYSGFFVAGGLVDQLIRECHRYRAAGEGALRDGRPSTAWFLLRTAALAATGDYVYRPPRLEVAADGLGRLSAPMPFLLCTTLEHSTELLDPYARRGAGPLRLTAVRSGAEGFWRRLPGLVRGRFADTMDADAGYLSGKCTGIRITGLRTVALDGQELELDPGQPLDIAPGREFVFLQP